MYNLIDKPWIWTTTNGEISLEKALVNAQEIGGLQGSTAMMVAAQYRVLLAVLHRAIDGPRSVDQWVDIWERGQFPAEAIEDYLGTWRDRFDLYGNLESPGFFQASAAIPVRERDVNKMVTDARSGGNVCLFGDGKPLRLAPGRAARNLVTIQAFALGGGSSGLPGRNFVDGPCARGIVFLILGNNLFETLMLNLLPYPETGVRAVLMTLACPSDRPVWERLDPFDRDPLVHKRGKWSPRGMTDLYTWPSRRIVLIPDEDSLQCSTMMFSCGLYLGPYRDPQQYYPRKRALRLSFPDSKSPETTVFDLAPAVLDEENRIAAASWVDRLREAGCDVEPRAVVAFGLASNLGAVLEERAITFPYPAQGCDEERASLAATKTAEGKLWATLGRAGALRRDGPAGRETDLSHVAIPPGWRGNYRRRLQRSFCDLIGGVIDNTMYLQRVVDAASQTYSEHTALCPASASISGEGLLRGGLKKAGIIESSEEENQEEN